MPRTKTSSDTIALIPAVGYIRMSTDDQKNSPERQRDEVLALAKREGFEIIRWYEDLGISGGESKNRPQFQNMMKDVSKREFKSILVYEPSRFTREDVLDANDHWKVLKKAGVSLVSVTKGEQRFDNLADLLTGTIEAHGNREELIKLADRSLSGRMKKAREGKLVGQVAFGYDREIFDEQGKFVKRVPFYDTFKRPAQWTAKLVPSDDPEVLNAVRFMFESVVNGTPLRQISAELNKKGIRTRRNCLFGISDIRRYVTNPVYIGVLRYGHKQSGVYRTVDELIMVPDAHRPLVSMELFTEANAVLKASYRRRGSVTLARYPLSGLLICQHCGGTMSGATTGAEVNGKKFRMYRCCSTKPGQQTCEIRPTVAAEHLEAFILRFIAENILCDDNLPILIERQHVLIQNEVIQVADYAELEALRSKIERAGKNLALAETDDERKTIRSVLSAMRQSEKRLAAKIHSLSKADPKQVAFSTVEDLRRFRDNLQRVNPVQLMRAIKETIHCITFGRSKSLASNCKNSAAEVFYNECFGTVEPNVEIYQGPPIQFCNDDLFGRRYVEVAEYVTHAGRKVGAAEVAEALEMPHTVALYHAKMAARNGLLVASKMGCAFRFEPLPESASAS